MENKGNGITLTEVTNILEAIVEVLSTEGAEQRYQIRNGVVKVKQYYPESKDTWVITGMEIVNNQLVVLIDPEY